MGPGGQGVRGPWGQGTRRPGARKQRANEIVVKGARRPGDRVYVPLARRSLVQEAWIPGVQGARGWKALMLWVRHSNTQGKPRNFNLLKSHD